MRLIDADELKKDKFTTDVCNGLEIEKCDVVGVAAIDNAPTVEERPKGEWIIDGHHIRCNRCNEYICNTDREGNEIPDNFCPNCGVRMRSVDEGLHERAVSDLSKTVDDLYKKLRGDV